MRNNFFEYMKDYCNKINYKILSTSYINSKTMMWFQCGKGHKFKTTWNHFKSGGTRCPICTGSNIDIDVI